MIRQYTTAICLLLLGVFMISCASPSEITRSEPKDTPEILDGNSNVTPLRNMPQQVKLPSSFLQAVQNKTRTLNGKPGPNYWTNTTLYDISVELFPDDTLLVGSANITYFNNSPDTLPAVVLELAQNLHQVNAIRKERVEITGGIQIRSVSVDEEKMTPINDFVPGYQVDGTNMIVVLPNEVAPKHSVSLKIEWAFKIPQAGASERMGYSYGNLYHIAYWYPKMSVYDDLEGWFLDEFTGNSEFYHGFGDYDLEITIPREWLVMGTGELINAKDILIPEVYEKYEAAFKTDSTYRIVDAENAQNATNRTASGKHTWKFRAKNVRDVAFSAVSQSTGMEPGHWLAI